AGMLQMCRRPNIVECLGLYAINGRQHLVTELADTDLGSILFYHTRLGEDSAATMTEQMLVGGRDPCYCKLGDFGTAMGLPSPSTRLHQRAGARGYCAPEMINGCYSIRADMWSLGIVIYEALHGRLPWFGKLDPSELEHKILREPIVWRLNAKLSKQAVQLLQHMLQRKPGRRISTGVALAHP
ncbi:Ulk3, partial [Symbiodinium sp. CCMP2456]